MPFCSVLHNHVCVRLPGNYAPCCYWNKDYTRFSDNPNKYFTSIDKSFRTNNSEFNLDEKRLIELNEVWFSIQNDTFKTEREKILIWALINKFDPKKEPKLMK